MKIVNTEFPTFVYVKQTCIFRFFG